MDKTAVDERFSASGAFEGNPSEERHRGGRAERENILAEERNCWRIAQANRVAFLVDAAAYFEAFASAAEAARESILILAWDIDSRVRLMRKDHDSGLPPELGNFLDAIVSRRKGLHAHILAWDFNPIYTFEREALPAVKLERRTHPRVHFQMDGNHPVWASLHQKVVVVDDSIAFAGGLDLTRSRWDTPEHLPKDTRRVDPSGAAYGPFHDVQIAVDGEAAAALGDLVRERWFRATGRLLRPPRRWRRDPWPDRLAPDIEDVRVGIARTEPAYKGSQGVREVESLHLDVIAAARRSIYIESPYLSSDSVGRALIARLGEENGPEIMIVLPKNSPGKFEESTMDTARSRLIRRLREADTSGRLRIYYPVTGNREEEWINVHSKVTIADDDIVRVGSSNLTNRSMGLDTECDLAIEAEGNPRLRSGIVEFRSRLLGEHLGIEPMKVAGAVVAKGSLIEAVESLRGGKRTLDVLAGEVPEWRDKLIPDTSIVDPERPLEPETVIRDFVSDDIRGPVRSRLLGWAVIFAAVLALGGLWKFTPLGSAATPETVAGWVDRINGHPAAPFLVIGAFVAGGLVAFPVTILIAATAFTFGPGAGFAYSLAGSFLSAMATYGIGRMFGGIPFRLVAGRRLDNLSRMLRRRGLVAVATVRVVPVAPFTFINLTAGALRIRPLDFALGTLIGMAPGLFAITFFGERLSYAVRHPGIESFLGLAALVAALVAAAEWLRRRLQDR
ncbi:MAG: VTT domain-containing protein [Deltaproteobacteria bacterium]|nr:VTT domain-containing protein [Deltaproteobacteria bacterium]